jgi:hypothetical protein
MFLTTSTTNEISFHMSDIIHFSEKIIKTLRMILSSPGHYWKKSAFKDRCIYLRLCKVTTSQDIANYSHSSTTEYVRPHTLSVCSDSSIQRTFTHLLTPAHIQTMNDEVILSEHLPMFSSSAFAQYRRRVLSAGKDLEFQNCSFQP